MEDFKAGGKPAAYGITFPMDGSDQFKSKMKYNQFSAYIQDQVNFSERFRLTGGLRLNYLSIQLLRIITTRLCCHQV